MKLRWTRPAHADLTNILDYLAKQSPQAASAVAVVLKSSVLQLINQPNSGRTGRVKNTQELVIPKLPYIVAYRVEGEFVDILAIRHTARLWPEKF